MSEKTIKGDFPLQVGDRVRTRNGTNGIVIAILPKASICNQTVCVSEDSYFSVSLYGKYISNCDYSLDIISIDRPAPAAPDQPFGEEYEEVRPEEAMAGDKCEWLGIMGKVSFIATDSQPIKVEFCDISPCWFRRDGSFRSGQRPSLRVFRKKLQSMVRALVYANLYPKGDNQCFHLTRSEAEHRAATNRIGMKIFYAVMPRTVAIASGLEFEEIDQTPSE